jgi:hypothetical protein
MSRTKSRAGGHVVQQVAELGFATEPTIARAVSVELGLPRIDLSMTPPEAEATALLDVRTCAERFVIPVALRENGELLWIAMADPTDHDAIALVRRKVGKRVRQAVAGPTEILRELRRIHSASTAATRQPEQPPADKLAAIEIDASDDEQIEIVGLMDDSASPLARIAAQLGAPVPEDRPAAAGVRQRASGRLVGPRAAPPSPERTAPIELGEALGEEGPALSAHAVAPRGAQRGGSRPKTGPLSTPPLGTAKVEQDPFATTAGGVIAEDDLGPEDVGMLEALRSSLEKGALVLRVIAQLCVEKQIFTREEMRKRR